jgi:hypothetical protein
MLPESDDDEITEEEVCVNDEVVAHPTRDDWHEQRECEQTCEAILHGHSTVVTIQITRTSSRSR